MEGGHCTRLRERCPFGVPPAHVYKGGGGERPAARRGAPWGGVLLGLLVQTGFAPPSFLPPEGIGRRGRGKGKGARHPRGLPSLSLRPMLAQHFPGGSGNPSVLRKNTRITWNHSGVRILPSNISIFTSQPFRDSSSCPRSHPGLRTNFGHQNT